MNALLNSAAQRRQRIKLQNNINLIDKCFLPLVARQNISSYLFRLLSRLCSHCKLKSLNGIKTTSSKLVWF